MTLNIKDKPKDGFERVVYAEEDKFNFYSVIAIHNTKRGPALGGCRYFNYQDFNKQEEDVLKLAEAMTYKNSLAELPFGGGKATIPVSYTHLRAHETIVHLVCRLLL